MTSFKATRSLGMRVFLTVVVLAVVFPGCGGEVAKPRTTTLEKTGGVPAVTLPEPDGDTPPLPAWRGQAPRFGGDEASGSKGRAWIVTESDADGDDYELLYLKRPGRPREVVARGGGVMEGSTEPRSPLWIGATLVWALAVDHNGTDYDGAIVSWDLDTGKRARVSVPNAYIESLARSRDGRRLAVLYVPTDETGQAVGPADGRARSGSFALSQLHP